MTDWMLDGRLGTQVTVDVCVACQSFWFDLHKSLPEPFHADAIVLPMRAILLERDRVFDLAFFKFGFAGFDSAR